MIICLGFSITRRAACAIWKMGNKEGEKILTMESVNSLRISAPQWWPLREGRDGKCEGRNEKCEFLARESVSSSPIVRIFEKGKCEFIADFSATMVTSLPSVSLCISLSHRKYLMHNIGSASALPIITNIVNIETCQKEWENSFSEKRRRLTFDRKCIFTMVGQVWEQKNPKV